MSLGCVCVLQMRFLGFIQLVVATGTVRWSSSGGFYTETNVTLRGKRERTHAIHIRVGEGKIVFGRGKI